MNWLQYIIQISESHFLGYVAGLASEIPSKLACEMKCEAQRRLRNIFRKIPLSFRLARSYPAFPFYT